MAPLKLFVDRMSQPSRAVLLLCQLGSIPHDEVFINLAKSKQRDPAYLTVNPLGTVPSIQEPDTGFCLAESPSILRYLAGTHNLHSWYPDDPKEVAYINSIMDWHLGNLRICCRTIVWHRAIVYLQNLKSNEAAVVGQFGLPLLRSSLKTMETVWLTSQGPFLGGRNHPSIADLLTGCEIEQMVLLNGSPTGPTMECVLQDYPKVSEWMKNLREECSPYWDQVHSILHRAAARLAALGENLTASGASAAATRSNL